MRIEGGNNPQSSLIITEDGQALTLSINETEQQDSAFKGLNFNVNTGTVNLTDAVETPLLYIENLTETETIKIPKIFFAFGTSDGTGDFFGNVYFNPTAGSILSGTVGTAFNFRVGDTRVLGADIRYGGTGDTFTAGEAAIKFLFPVDKQRPIVLFDHIVIPRGNSILVTLQPPAGNTSFNVQCGTNVFVKDVDL